MNNLNKDVKLFQVDGIPILGNFQNGAIIGLDEEAKEYILNRAPYDWEEKSSAVMELEEALHELEFYSDNRQKELEAAYVHVTDRCNLHCLGCYSYVEQRNEQQELSKAEFFHILASLRRAGVKKLVFSGGEPFLRRDFWQILKFAKEECNIPSITVITNGTLDFTFYESCLPYLDEINVSVDGYGKDTYFIRDKGIMPKVIETIKGLQKHLKVNLIITLHKKNMEYMGEYKAFARELEADYSYSIFTVEPDNVLFQDHILKEKDLLYLEKKLMELNGQVSIQDFPAEGCNLICRNRCEAGDKLISVGADGTVYPCHMLHKKELALGNALELDIKDIVFNAGNPFQDLSVDEIRGCRNCNYKYLCGGGCRGRSYLYYAQIDKKDAFCTMIKKYYIDIMANIAATIENNK